MVSQKEENDFEWKKINEMINEMINAQEKNLLALGRQIVPGVTSEDILQPNDFPDLENHPIFRYEEGILTGMRSVQIGLLVQRESSKHFEKA